MTIDELYQVLDNITILAKFYIIDNIEGDVLEWGSTFSEIPYQTRSMPIVHCKYNEREIIIWV